MSPTVVPVALRTFAPPHLPVPRPARLWAAVGVTVGAALLGGCVVAPIDEGYADYGYSATTVYTRYGHPPPPRVEYRSAAPAPGYVWMAGDWWWGGSRYDWRPGRWAAPGYRQPPMPPRPQFQSPPPRPQMQPAPGYRPPMVQPPGRPVGPPPQFVPPAPRPPWGGGPHGGMRNPAGPDAQPGPRGDRMPGARRGPPGPAQGQGQMQPPPAPRDAAQARPSPRPRPADDADRPGRGPRDGRGDVRGEGRGDGRGDPRRPPPAP